jgi:hypothetical protein
MDASNKGLSKRLVLGYLFFGLCISQPAKADPNTGSILVIASKVDGSPAANVLLARTGIYEGRRPTDKTGKFRFYEIPIGSTELEAHCSSSNYVGRKISSTKLKIESEQTTIWKILVPDHHCDEPAYSERAVTLSGRFIFEFESNVFEPDDRADLGLTQNTFEDQPAQIWVESLPEKAGIRRFPSHAQIRAILKGPGRFGHMGGSDYGLVVLEIMK